MPPLLPSESAAYSLTFPAKVEDDRLNLDVRTGAALTSTRSSIVVHGGLTVGLSLKHISIPEIKSNLEVFQNRNLSDMLSNEFFYLNIISRKWTRIEWNHSQNKPQPRFYHSVAFHGSTIFLFGGLTIDEDTEELYAINDLWEFNLESLQWTCLDDGLSSGTVARFNHTVIVSEYSNAQGEKRLGLIIAGGKGELGQDLNHIVIYDLERRTYLPTTDMNLTFNERSYPKKSSIDSQIDPKALNDDSSIEKMRVTSESSFIISGSSSDDHTDADAVLHILAPLQQDKSSDVVTNPLVTLPLIPHSIGLRLPLADVVQNRPSVVPSSLKCPSGGTFGPNIIVSGFNEAADEYEVYMFNLPSQKWTRLNIDNNKRASELYLWKSLTWPSHHKVIILGSASIPRDAEYNTLQTFDMLILVGLPITNIFHSFAHTDANFIDSKRSASSKPNSSFEEYSKYIAPSTKISSIRSVFPNYAVTLGRNAFQRYGASFADFEFITAEGDKVNVPLMLLRKRWGRCFDMLLAKGYARAVHHLESKKEDETEADGIEDSPEPIDMQSMKSTGTSKKSLIMINRGQRGSERDIPQFRLPFQDGGDGAGLNSPLLTEAPASTGSVSGPTSRKASIISTGNISMASSSANIELDFDDLPAQPLFPTEPLPQLDSKAPLKSLGSRDYLRDSPRGSVSGNSISSGLNPTSSPGLKFKDLRASMNFKKRGISHSSSTQIGEQSSGSDSVTNLESIAHAIEDDTATLLEPLLIPRSLYLPFPSATVTAFSEYLFTGQLGDKWLLSPTTTDTFLMAKFFEIPLLYDLITEALYAVIGKKENALCKEFSELLQEYRTKVSEIFHRDPRLIIEYYEKHPHVNQSFQEMEDYLNTVDDGYMNLALLRKASKASSSLSSSAVNSQKSVNTSDNGRRGSAKLAGKVGKSRLSKEVIPDPGYIDDDDEFGDDELDDEYTGDDELGAAMSTKQNKSFKAANNAETTPIFRTDAMSTKDSEKRIAGHVESIDPMTPLVTKEQKNGQEEGEEKVALIGKEASPALEITTDSELSSDARRAVDETEVIDGRRLTLTTSEDLEDEDPLSTNAPSLGSYVKDSDFDDSVDPLKRIEDGNSSEPQAVDFQVPEGRFELARERIVKPATDSSSDKHTSSDADDMAVGLGLVGDLKLRLKSIKDQSEEAEAEQEDEDPELPTLENLASPDSPAPADHLLQVIYEVSSLACDMKLLLRSVNVLEMSKNFESKKVELLAELEEVAKEVKENPPFSDATIKEIERKEQEAKAVKDLQTSKTTNPSYLTGTQIEGSKSSSATKSSSTKENSPSSTASKKSEPSISPKDSKDLSTFKKVATTDGIKQPIKSFSMRSTFSATLRSLSSSISSRDGHKGSFAESVSNSVASNSDASAISRVSRNPFERKRTDEGGVQKKGGLFSPFRSRKTE